MPGTAPCIPPATGQVLIVHADQQRDQAVSRRKIGSVHGRRKLIGRPAGGRDNARCLHLDMRCAQARHELYRPASVFSNTLADRV